MTTTAIANAFMDLFSGFKSAHGLYDLSSQSQREDGKITGRAATKHEPVTQTLWERHLDGTGPGLGIIPIDEKNECSFGAIDIDYYQGLDLRAIAVKLRSNKLPLIVCRSKSGGAHIYCFSSNVVSAQTMKNKLSEVASFLSFGGSEIFPKQTQLLVDRGDLGSWISMPYYNGVRGLRYAVDESGDALSISQFLERAESSKVSDDWFGASLVLTDAFIDGPPCLQTLSQIGYPEGTRNDGLFNIGVYLRKSRPDDWEHLVDEFNHEYMQPPLATVEVQALVKSLKRKDYAYGCAKQPICNHCNSALCRTRKFGVGSGNSGRFPVLGQLTKLDTRPPIWFWSVDGARMELTTIELQDPRLFQRKCIDVLNMVPTLPSRPVWEAAVQNALATVTVVDAPADASPEGQFWDMLEKFCTGRAQALTIDEIVLGKPFSDKGRTYFRMSDLLGYLARNKFFEFRSTKVASLLKDSGAQHHFSSLKGRGVNYWSVKEMAKQTSGFDVPKMMSEKGDAF